MKKVYTSPNIPLISIVKAALENHGIPCVLKNDNLSGALGELPFTEIWPELWILKERDLSKTEQLIQQIISDNPEHQAAWQCPKCQEEIEKYFSECWNCGYIPT